MLDGYKNPRAYKHIGGGSTRSETCRNRCIVIGWDGPGEENGNANVSKKQKFLN